MRVIDLFNDWDTDGNGKISKEEFRNAMGLLGFNVPAEDIDALFDSWDPDGSGEPSTVASGVGSAYGVRGLGSGGFQR